MNFSKDYQQFISNLEECLEDPLDLQFLNLIEHTATKIFKPQYSSLLPPPAIQKPLQYICQCCKEPLEFANAALLIKHIKDKSIARQKKIWSKKISKTCRCCKVPRQFESTYGLARHTATVANGRISAITRKIKQKIAETYEENEDDE